MDISQFKYHFWHFWNCYFEVGNTKHHILTIRNGKHRILAIVNAKHQILTIRNRKHQILAIVNANHQLDFQLLMKFITITGLDFSPMDFFSKFNNLVFYLKNYENWFFSLKRLNFIYFLKKLKKNCFFNKNL